MNPQYSLRSFAKMLGISPFKLSEFISGKKRLSQERAQEIVCKLGLQDKEKEIFLISLQLESSAKNIDKKEIQQQLKTLLVEVNSKKTSQKNAWYFGAVGALERAGYDSRNLKNELNLTDLQIENANRFINRIRRFYPDRKEFSLDTASVLKKIEEEIFIDSNDQLEADFVFLSATEMKEFRKKIKSLIRLIKSKSKNESPEDLTMIYWGSVNLIKKKGGRDVN